MMSYQPAFSIVVYSGGSEIERFLLDHGWVTVPSSSEKVVRFQAQSVIIVSRTISAFRTGGFTGSIHLAFFDETQGYLSLHESLPEGFWIQRSVAAFLAERSALESGSLFDPNPTDLRGLLCVRTLSLITQSPERPLRVSPFFGRQNERKAILDRLQLSRLVTVLGQPGVGKSALLTVLHEDLEQTFKDGVVKVNFAYVPSGLVLPMIANCFRQTAEGLEVPPATLQWLQGRIQSRDLLIVLDNCEHLSSEVGEVSTLLLALCPNLSILVSSRVKIAAQSQVLFTLGGLEIPEEVGELWSLECSPAIALFVDRAQSVCQGFTLNQDNAPHVIGICRELEGNPLAIEFAAKKTSVMSPRQLFYRLEDRLSLFKLTGSTSQQASLQVALQWSYDLLPKEAREVLQRLVYIEGAIEIDMLQWAWDDSDLDVRNREVGFTQLVEHSLLSPIKEFQQRRFFAISSSQKLFTKELVKGSKWIKPLFERINRSIEGLLVGVSSERLALAYPDVKATISRLMTSKDYSRAASVIRQTFFFWYEQGFADEGIEIVESFLSKADLTKVDVVDRIYNVLSHLYQQTGQSKKQEWATRSALVAAYETEIPHRIGTAMLNYGRYHNCKIRGNRWLGRAIKLFKNLCDLEMVSTCLQSMVAGNTRLARFEANLELAKRHPSSFESDPALWNNLALSYLHLGDLENCRIHLTRAVFRVDSDPDIPFKLGTVESVSSYLHACGKFEESATLDAAIASLAPTYGLLPDLLFHRDSLWAQRTANPQASPKEGLEFQTIEDLIEYSKSMITGN